MKKYVKYIVIALIVIVIAIFIGIVVNGNSKPHKKANAKKLLDSKTSSIIFVKSSDKEKCSKCSEIQKYLDKKNINYYLFDVEKESQEDYASFLKTLNIPKDIFGYPAVIYIKDNMMFANIINIDKTEVVERFIKDYKLDELN